MIDSAGLGISACLALARCSRMKMTIARISFGDITVDQAGMPFSTLPVLMLRARVSSSPPLTQTSSSMEGAEPPSIRTPWQLAQFVA